MYFVTITQNLVDDIGETGSKSQNYLQNPNEHSIFLKEVEPGEIKNMNKLHIKEVSDIFDITRKLQRQHQIKLLSHLRFYLMKQ